MAKLFWEIVITIVVYFLPISFAARANPETVYISEMKQCPGRTDLPIMGYNFTLDRANRTQHYLSGDIVMKEAFPKGFKGK